MSGTVKIIIGILLWCAAIAQLIGCQLFVHHRKKKQKREGTAW